MSKVESLRVNIRPEVTILSVLQHLNYRPWFALAEFVDNSLQSFLANEKQLKAIHGNDFQLCVEIDVSAEGPGRIVITDNAAGIPLSEFPRAFRPAELPPDRSGLSEFGMGMKSAACWFARRWQVRTKAINETKERLIQFDIDAIVANRTESMDVTERQAAVDAHYTEIILEGLHHPPRGRTVGKIRDHLASIYRVFLRENGICLKYNGDPLTFDDPPVLVAKPAKGSDGSPVEWRKDISFDFGFGQRVTGFAAIRETASVPFAGFALFRRKRLIEGSGDETYRPPLIFGKSNSFRYQRLFGELHLDGFEISHTKDGFRWEEHEDLFLELLREELERAPLNLLEQAEKHRTRATKGTFTASAEAAIVRVADTIQHQVPSVVERESSSPPQQTTLPPVCPADQFVVSSRLVRFSVEDKQWEVTIRTSIEPAQPDWLRIAESFVSHEESGAEVRCLAIEVSLSHPFVSEFVGAEQENMEVLLRLGAAIAIALILTEDANGVPQSIPLHFLNTILREAMWRD